MTLPPTYFEDLYGSAEDPWGFQTRWYERRKYALTLAALPRARFGSGLELGCSIGVLTQQLAGRCEALLAIDVSGHAVAATRRRLVDVPGVQVEQGVVPDDWPDGSYDLVVLSEVGYYLARSDLDRLLARVASSLAVDGVFVAVHWRHPVADYPLGGDEVHAAIASITGWQRTVAHTEADFLLEVYERAPARSVAQTEGLVS